MQVYFTVTWLLLHVPRTSWRRLTTTRPQTPSGPLAARNDETENPPVINLYNDQQPTSGLNRRDVMFMLHQMTNKHHFNIPFSKKGGEPVNITYKTHINSPVTWAWHYHCHSKQKATQRVWTAVNLDIKGNGITLGDAMGAAPWMERVTAVR
jgi:hypothetical protein